MLTVFTYSSVIACKLAKSFDPLTDMTLCSISSKLYARSSQKAIDMYCTHTLGWQDVCQGILEGKLHVPAATVQLFKACSDKSNGYCEKCSFCVPTQQALELSLQFIVYCYQAISFNSFETFQS